MQINPINNNSFCGIKLSSNDYNKTRDIALTLKKYDFYCLGHKTFYCNNSFQDKANLMQNIRNKAYFYQRGFGAIFLPWSNEAYFISEPKNEQKLINAVKELDEGATLNLAI